MSRPVGLSHQLWRLLPAMPRRWALARVFALTAPRPVFPAPVGISGMIIAGELTRASGLGEGARLMLRALKMLGVPAWPLDVGPLLPAHTPDLSALIGSGNPPPGAALVLHVNPPLLPLLLTRLPRALVLGRRLVGFWVWELPVAPPEWSLAARLVHDVWTPSRFSAAALTPLCSAPPRVVPHPVASVPLAPAPLGRGDFGLPDEAVVVLVSFNLASSMARKNPLAAIAAFRRAFGDRPDRILLLKVGNPTHYPEDFATLSAAASGAANIRLETRTLPAADSLALTACADMVLSLHRSEGVGLVLGEAMLLGKPVIATGWSGNLEFMDETSAALVRFRLVPVADPRAVYGGSSAVWAEADVEHAAAWLRRLADDTAARQALSVAGRAMARARLGMAPLAAAVRALGVEAVA